MRCLLSTHRARFLMVVAISDYAPSFFSHTFETMGGAGRSARQRGGSAEVESSSIGALTECGRFPSCDDTHPNGFRTAHCHLRSYLPRSSRSITHHFLDDRRGCSVPIGGVEGHNSALAPFGGDSAIELFQQRLFCGGSAPLLLTRTRRAGLLGSTEGCCSHSQPMSQLVRS